MLSVHTIVSASTSPSRQVPGWHATIFPPYFVAGAIFAGFAMVMIIAIPLRKFYGLEDFVTMRHFDYMGRITLATGLFVGYGYMMETFMALYSGNNYEIALMMQPLHRPVRAALLDADLLQRRLDPAAVVPARAARACGWLFLISIIVSIGMWLERFIIIPVSLSRDFLPSSWGMYYPTFWDWSTFVGTIGLFVIAAVPLHPLAADDLDLRDAHLAAGGRR